jgi:hypothetical protein
LKMSYFAVTQTPGERLCLHKDFRMLMPSSEARPKVACHC